MAQNFNPLDLATQLQLPVPGTLPAPEGDTSGANPYGEFTYHSPDHTADHLSAMPQAGPGTIIPPAVAPPVAAPQDTIIPAAPQDPQAPMPEVKPLDPRTVISLPQGTAPPPAAPTTTPSGWSGAPVYAPEKVPSGSEFTYSPAHTPLLPKADPAAEQEAWYKKAYDGVKAVATETVDDVAQGAVGAVQLYANMTGQLKVPEGEGVFSRNWDQSLRTPDQIDSSQRGLALIASTVASLEVEGMNLASSLVPASMKAKAMSWLATHMANGAVAGAEYGVLTAKSTKPTDLIQSTLDNVETFMVQVPLIGAAFKGFGIAGKTALNKTGVGPALADALSRTGRDAKFVLLSAAEKMTQLADQMRYEGSDPKMLPENVRDALWAQAVREAHTNMPQSKLDLQHGPAVGPTKKAFVAPSMTPKAPVGDLNLGDPIFTGASKGGTMPEMTAPRDVNLDLPPGDGGTMPDMTPPREPILPEPGHEHQERIATGVYRNPDGTIQAFGYRGVSPVEASWKDNLDFENQTPGGKRMRSPTEPGQMDAISISPHDTFAQGFGDLHYMEANFDNPLVIDDWHQSISKGIEKLASHFDTNMLDPGRIQNGGPTFQGKKIGFLGDRQPGVIWAARQLGHDGIIVRHGEESVEIVALHPSKVRSSGAADYAASDNSIANKTPIASTPEQQLIKDRAATSQNGVRDLGKSSTDLRGATPEVVNSHVQAMIDQHMKVQTAPSLYDVKQTLQPGEDLHQQYDIAKLRQQEGLWKLDGRTYQAEVVPTTPEDPRYINSNPFVKLEIKDVTGQAGVDPAVDPTTAKVGLAYDGIAKGMDLPDISKMLDLEHQVVAQKLLDYEPNPAEHNRIFVYDRNVRTLLSAMESIESGNMDDAVMRLTQPREIEFPELHGGEPTRPPKTAKDYKLNEESAIAPDGRILNETVDEHLRHAQQFKNFGELKEAARRTKWAFEKDPVEAERMVRENPGKYDMPNPVHTKTNADLISPDERQLLDMYRQRIRDNNSEFNIAIVDNDRPRAVMLAKILSDSRAGIERILTDVQDRAYGKELMPSYDTINKVRPFTYESYMEGKHLLPDAQKMIEEKKALGKRTVPFQVGHVSVPPILEQRPPWASVAEGTHVPQIADDWALLHRMHPDDVKDIVNNLPLDGEPLKPKSLRQGFMRNGDKREPMGAVQAMTLLRIASGGSSTLLYSAAYQEDDPRTRRHMRTAAGVLATIAILPSKNGWLAKKMGVVGQKTIDAVLLRMFDLPAYLTATVGEHAATAVRTAANLGNEYNLLNMLRTTEIKKMFPSATLRETAMRALDEPTNQVYWGQFTPAQSQFLVNEGIFNMTQQAKLQQLGVTRQFQDDLWKHILPKRTFEAWKSAEKNGPTSSYTKLPRTVNIATMEAWAKLNKLPTPIVDLAYVQSRHMGEVGRTIMVKQMVNEMTRIGALIPSTDNIPDGWSVPTRVTGLGKMMAPDGVTIALDRMHNPNGSGAVDGTVLRAIDDLRSWQLRMIMAWPLVHGANMIRRAVSMGTRGVIGTVQNYNAVQLSDPSSFEAARHGLKITGGRTDYSVDHQNAMEGMFNNLAMRSGKFGKIVLAPVANGFGYTERALWEHLVPSVGLTGYNIQMKKWVDRTGGKFIQGSPEYEAAGQAAAAFGNTMMGKTSTILRSPGAEYAMRQLFFAPNWFESQLKINMTALGEARGLFTGETKLSDLTYLPVKVKSMLATLATTYTVSYLLSGQAPKFNPQSNKYYALTGVQDRNGRNLGIDLNGYWSDDSKMYGDPTMYFMNRISPQLQFTHTFLTGRDAFGRVITDENLIDGGLSQLGPISTATNALARSYNGGGEMSSGDKLKSAIEMSQLGSVSAMPRVKDLMFQKTAHRILRINGLPADDPDKIYELQQILAAADAGHKMAGGGKQLINWIAQQKQAQKNQNPRVIAIQRLWEHTRDAIGTFGRAAPAPSLDAAPIVPQDLMPPAQ